MGMHTRVRTHVRLLSNVAKHVLILIVTLIGFRTSVGDIRVSCGHSNRKSGWSKGEEISVA